MPFLRLQAKIEGASWHLIIGEEAQDINAYVWRKSIVPMAASTAASFVQIGTWQYDQGRLPTTSASRMFGRDVKQQASDPQAAFPVHFEVAARESEPVVSNFTSRKYRWPTLGYRLRRVQAVVPPPLGLLERAMFVEPTLFDLMGKNYSPVTYDVRL